MHEESAARASGQGLSAAIAAALFVAVTAAYLAVPMQHGRGWDPLVTGTMLRLSDHAPTYAWLHHAHMATIPVTWMVWLLTGRPDPLMAVTVTQTMGAALSTVVLFFTLRVVTRDHWLSAALAICLPAAFSVWYGSTTGEEKPLGMLGQACALMLLFRPGEPSRGRAVLLAVSLAAAVLVHVMNGVLVASVGVYALCARFFRVIDARSMWRIGGAALAAGLAVAAVYLAVGRYFFGLTTLAGYRGWLTQYYSGQVMDMEDHTTSVFGLPLRWLVGFHELLLHPKFVPPGSWGYLAYGGLFIAVLAGAVALLVLRREETRRVALWWSIYTLGYLLAFARVEPYHWETWLGLYYGSLIAVGAALSTLERGPRRGIAAALAVLLVACNVLMMVRDPLAYWYSRDRDVVASVSARVAADGWLLHDFIFTHHYFLIYAPARTILADDMSELGRKNLSRYAIYRSDYAPVFYNSGETPAGIRKRIESGGAVYLLALRHPLSEQYYQQFGEFEVIEDFDVPASGGMPLRLYRVKSWNDAPSGTMINPTVGGGG